MSDINEPVCPQLWNPRGHSQVTALLENSPYFKRFHGEDHFLLHAVNQPVSFFNNRPACMSFLCMLCQNCSKLSIDTYPQGYRRGQYLPRWHSIPFPGNYHYSSQVTHEPWRVESPPLNAKGKDKGGVVRRQFAVSFLGTTYSSLDKSRWVTRTYVEVV